MSGIPVNPGKELWRMNAVLNGRNSDYVHTGIKGTLSIKSVLNGRGWWHTQDGSYRVDEDSFLVLNHAQYYDIEIVTPRPVETFCLFFRPGFVEEVAQGRGASVEAILDLGDSAPLGFYERLNAKSHKVGAAIHAIQKRIPEATDWEGEELFLALAEALVEQELGMRSEAEALPLASGKARDEVYRRLLRGRDFMLGNLHTKISYEEAAREAFLSPYHFHRLFRQAFGATPNAYLQEHRLQKAKRLLREDSMEVQEVCWAVGYDSASTFNGLFKRRTGMTPIEYRRSHSQD